MKASIIIISLLIFLISCFKKVDDKSLNSICTDSCTVVKGQFATGNNEGIANIHIEIQSETIPNAIGLGQTSIRKIASGKTDINGFYSLKFELNSGEYGESSRARVLMYFNYDKSNFLPVSYYENFGTYEFLGPFRTKDTSIIANIFLTTKSKIKIRLENFVPFQSGDYFSIMTSCQAGLDRHYGNGDIIESIQNVTEKEIFACGNEQTILYIRKRKNGITSTSDTTIFTPTGQLIAARFSY